MATITGFTAARMLEIEDATIISAEVVAGNLILTKHDGTTVDAGPVIGPEGPVGPGGPAGGLIPGEVRLWPSDTLPLLADYGLWAWADGAVYAVATYPLAAGHIASAWRTFGGASDPGGANFRVPDLRGLVPAGLDAMPGGARANRMTRSVAIVLAGKTGEETHVITIPEMANHNHGGGNHGHGTTENPHTHEIYNADAGSSNPFPAGDRGSSHTYSPSHTSAPASTGLTINNSGTIVTAQGGNGAHENVQPTVFVPYIVKLDD